MVVHRPTYENWWLDFHGMMTFPSFQKVGAGQWWSDHRAILVAVLFATHSEIWQPLGTLLKLLKV